MTSETGSNARFQVVRVDDNGNEFVLGEFALEELAEASMRDWESKIGEHKQTVFVRRIAKSESN